MINTSCRSDIEQRVAKFLVDSKFPPHYSGYNYMKELIIQIIMAITAGKMPDKSIWNIVATKFDTSVSNVERCMRTVTEVWWDKYCIFDMFPEKPTSRECAMLCAEYILLGLDPDYEPPNGKKK